MKPFPELLVRAILVATLSFGHGVSYGEAQSSIFRGDDVGKVSLLEKLDHPAVNSAIFFPRPASGLPAPPGSDDLMIPVGDGVRIAARYHPSDLSLPTVLHFHGNGEIVSGCPAIDAAENDMHRNPGGGEAGSSWQEIGLKGGRLIRLS